MFRGMRMPAFNDEIEERVAWWTGVLAWLIAALVLAGTFVFYSEWFLWHSLKWLMPIYGILLILRGDWRQNRWLWGAFFWLGWMGMRAWLGADEAGVEKWWWGGVGLIVWLMAVVEVGRSERKLTALAWVVVGAATVSVGVSLWYHLVTRLDWHWGWRLQNTMVYGGWNAVCAGMTWGFASVWALILASPDRGTRHRAWIVGTAGVMHAVLVFATFATLSRGALLVLIAGHGVFLFLRWRTAWPGVLRVGLVMGAFHWFLPAITEAQQLPPEEESEIGKRYPRVIDANPLAEWTKRGSTGRLQIYGAVANQVRTGGVGPMLWGEGILSDDRQWIEEVGEDLGHTHSIWFGTLLHGGAIGVIGLAALWLVAVLRAGWRPRSSRVQIGLTIAIAGAAGLVFDGQTVQALNSVPRFEPLLFWTGLALLLGAREAKKEGLAA